MLEVGVTSHEKLGAMAPLDLLGATPMLIPFWGGEGGYDEILI